MIFVIIEAFLVPNISMDECWLTACHDKSTKDDGFFTIERQKFDIGGMHNTMSSDTTVQGCSEDNFTNHFQSQSSNIDTNNIES